MKFKHESVGPGFDFWSARLGRFVLGVSRQHYPRRVAKNGVVEQVDQTMYGLHLTVEHA